MTRHAPGPLNPALLRSCGGCNAHLLTNDGRSQTVYCQKCRPKHVRPHAEWVAGLKAGDIVFVNPINAWRGLSRSRCFVVARDEDDDKVVIVQIIGLPESRQRVGVHALGQHDMTPRRSDGALD